MLHDAVATQVYSDRHQRDMAGFSYFVVTHEMKGGRGFHDALVLCLEAIEGWLE